MRSIKVLCCAAIVGAGLIGAPSSALASGQWEVFGVEVDKKDPNLNIREKGRRGATIVAKLPSGTKVELLETKGDWRKVKVASGADSGKVGWGYVCCLRPVGATDLYRTLLSSKDHYNRKGVRLKSAAGIVQQDRANFHRFDDKDKGDGHDRVFHEREKRDWLASTLSGTFSPEDAKAILWHTPRVEVIVYPDKVRVSVLERGDKMPDAK